MTDVADTATTDKTSEPGTYLALPQTREGLLAMRKKPTKAKLHDQVEDIYLALYENDEFWRLREPVYRAQSIEGDLRDDDVCAARMIRDEAKRRGDLMVAKEKLAVIRRSIMVVEMRYNATRKQRLELAEA